MTKHTSDLIEIDQYLEGATLRLNHVRLHLARASCLSDRSHLVLALDDLGIARRTIVEMQANIDGLRIDWRNREDRRPN